MGTRGPVFVLALVAALLAGALIGLLLERGAGERGAAGTEPGGAARAPAQLVRADGIEEPVERTEAAGGGRAPRDTRADARADDDALGELAGRVVDASSRPLAGARVTLERPEARAFEVLDTSDVPARTPYATATTVEDGSFRFRVPRGIPFDAVAELDGWGDALRTDAYAGQELELVLERGVLVFGTVTRRRDGAPVEGAKVRVFRLGGPDTLERATTTAPDGGYALRVPFRTDARLEVVPERLQASDWIELALGSDERVRQDVALADGVTVEGRVTDAATGLAIAGATVGEGWWFRRTATTDARGEYRLEGYGAPGVRELCARAPGYGSARVANPPPPSGAVVRVDFALVRGRTVTGRVIDESDRPVADAYVAAVASEFGDDGQRTDWLSTRTDATGRYRIEGLARDLGHALFVARQGYGTQVHDFPEDELARDELELADVVLRRPALLSGTVVDAADAPLADVEVELRGWNHDRYRFVTRATERGRFYVDTRSARTDARGRFWFGDVAAGRYQLVARVPGRPETPPLELELVTAERREGIVLRLDDGGSIRGVVQDEHGRGLPGVYVSARAERLADAGARPPGHVHAVSAADGAFTIAGLPAGEYALHAYPLETPADSPDEPWLPASVEHLATGAQPVVIELARGAAIRGRVLDAAGLPLAEHPIAASNGSSSEYARTDAEGRFALTVPRGSRWTLEVRAGRDGAAFGEVLLRRTDVEPGEVELRLER